MDASEKGFYGWPRVDAACRFKQPARFQDKVIIHLMVKEIKIRSIEYNFKFYRETVDKENLLAVGKMSTVYAQKLPDDSIVSASLNPIILEKIQEAPADILPKLR